MGFLALYVLIIICIWVISFALNDCKSPVVEILVAIVIALVFTSLSFYIDYAGLPPYDRYINALHFDNYYDQFVDRPLSVISDGMELPAWGLINVISKYVFNSSLMFISSLLFFYIFTSVYMFHKIEGIKTSTAVLLFFLTIAPLYSTELSRQFCAISFVNLGVASMLQEHKARGVVGAIIGAMIHPTVAIVPIAWVLCRALPHTKLIKIYVLIMASVVCIPLLLILIDKIWPSFSNLFSVTYGGDDGTYAQSIKGMPYFIFAVVSTIGINNDRGKLMYRFSSVCAFLCFATCIASVDEYWLWRMALNVMPYGIVCMAYNLNLKNKNLRIVSQSSVILMTLLLIREIVVLYPSA